MANNVKNRNTETSTLPADFIDGFAVVDGVIPPAWHPDHDAKFSDLKESARLEKIAESDTVTTSVAIRGTLAIASAWGRAANMIDNAVDVEGKSFPRLRIPDSGPLLRALAHVPVGEEILITYKGKVPVKGATNGEKTHLWTVAMRDPSRYLADPRADAPRATSKKEREVAKLRRVIEREMNDVRLTNEQAKLMHEKALIASGKHPALLASNNTNNDADGYDDDVIDD